MALEGISISLEEVSAMASSIAGRNEQLTQILNDISTRMSSLSSSWQSEAGELIRSKMEGMKPHFQEYHNIIESYVKFLNDTVSAYGATESQIKGNASAFQG